LGFRGRSLTRVIVNTDDIILGEKETRYEDIMVDLSMLGLKRTQR